MAKGESLTSHPAISAHDLRRVAVSATCDPRCIVKYLRGMNVQATTRSRVERSLRICGREDLVGYATRITATAAANAQGASSVAASAVSSASSGGELAEDGGRAVLVAGVGQVAAK